MQPQQAHLIYEFGDFELDALRRVLCHARRTAGGDHRPGFRSIGYLVERAGAAHRKEGAHRRAMAARRRRGRQPHADDPYLAPGARRERRESIATSRPSPDGAINSSPRSRRAPSGPRPIRRRHGGRRWSGGGRDVARPAGGRARRWSWRGRGQTITEGNRPCTAIDRRASVRRHERGAGPGAFRRRIVRGNPESARACGHLARDCAHVFVLVQGPERRYSNDRAAFDCLPRTRRKCPQVRGARAYHGAAHRWRDQRTRLVGHIRSRRKRHFRRATGDCICGYGSAARHVEQHRSKTCGDLEHRGLRALSARTAPVLPAIRLGSPAGQVSFRKGGATRPGLWPRLVRVGRRLLVARYEDTELPDAMRNWGKPRSAR